MLMGWDYVSELRPPAGLLSFRWYMNMESHDGMISTGKAEELGEIPVPVPLCPPQIPHRMTRVRTRASAVRGRRLTAWATARSPVVLTLIIFLYESATLPVHAFSSLAFFFYCLLARFLDHSSSSSPSSLSTSLRHVPPLYLFPYTVLQV
jgi:hypothetical protein